MTDRDAWAPGTTHWSQLLGPEAHQEAWQFFYGNYKDAVAALFRRSGVPMDQVEDLVHEFFTVSLQREFLAKADPQRGRFRGYLCMAARRFLASEWRKSGRLKRRPDEPVLALDSAIGASIVGGATPEQEFDLSWARAVLARAVSRATRTAAAEGKAAHATAFTLRQEGVSWKALATQLQTTATAARGWVARFEKRVADQVRREVIGTVAGEEELEAELRELSEILSRG